MPCSVGFLQLPFSSMVRFQLLVALLTTLGHIFDHVEGYGYFSFDFFSQDKVGQPTIVWRKLIGKIGHLMVSQPKLFIDVSSISHSDL